jgi:hypothetical protein
MEGMLWILAAPVVLVLPGLLPARLVTGTLRSGWTLAWASFFSVVLLPPLAFGAAMLLGTTMNARLVLPLAAALGVAGLIFPRPAKPDARARDL